MRTIICGGRDGVLTDNQKTWLDVYKIMLPISVVISGSARGYDREGEIWANNNAIPVERYPAEWDKYGKSAGYRRNEDMAKIAEACVVLPGGKGTQHMFDIATRYKLVVRDLRNMTP